MIHTGDCIEVMRTLPADSVDAVVTDPPAGVSFMSKTWDHNKGGRTEWVAWMTEVMRECYRVLKPGGYAVVWSLPRTCHWTAWAMEDAGFVIRDQLAHIFASGFPKGKAQLKPAREDWWLARKPGPLRPLGIDAGRIGTEELTAHGGGVNGDRIYGAGKGIPAIEAGANPHTGRWPSNVLLDPDSAALFDEPNPEVVGSGQETAVLGHYRDPERIEERDSMFLGKKKSRVGDKAKYAGDTGGYSRFFLVPKSSRADREPVVRGQVERAELQTMGDGANGHDPARPIVRENAHPTVKPVSLMRHLIRLVTPSGGTVLDPFLGSGSTAIAAELEGFPWIGIEQSVEYVAIAEARLNGTQRGLGLDVGAPTKARTATDVGMNRLRQSIIEKGRKPHEVQGWGFSGGTKPVDKEPAA